MTCTASSNNRPHSCDTAPRPALASDTLSLFCETYFTSSAALAGGRSLRPSNVIGTSATWPIYSKSFSGLYDSFLYSAGAVAMPL
ncbi:hypothetical protein D3C87_1869220 [compost metagenome]